MEMLKFLGFALIASLALIVLAKVILQFLIRKPADYYIEEEARQDDLIMKPIREERKGN